MRFLRWLDRTMDNGIHRIYMSGIRLGTNKYEQDHPEYRRWRRVR